MAEGGICQSRRCFDSILKLNDALLIIQWVYDTDRLFSLFRGCLGAVTIFEILSHIMLASTDEELLKIYFSALRSKGNMNKTILQQLKRRALARLPMDISRSVQNYYLDACNWQKLPESYLRMTQRQRVGLEAMLNHAYLRDDIIQIILCHATDIRYCTSDLRAASEGLKEALGKVENADIRDRLIHGFQGDEPFVEWHYPDSSSDDSNDY